MSESVWVLKWVATRWRRDRRVVWDVERQDLKAERDEVAARVASVGLAEDAWWRMRSLAPACVTGMVVWVWMGLLSIQRGIVGSVLEDIAGRTFLSTLPAKRICLYYRVHVLLRIMTSK
jgi:hypothetical protein